MEDLTVGLSDELKNKNISVVGVSPSDVATEEYIKFFPEDSREALRPDYVAKFIVDLYGIPHNGEIWVLKNNQEPTKYFHK